jgi:hypothetical protein
MKICYSGPTKHSQMKIWKTTKISFGNKKQDQDFYIKWSDREDVTEFPLSLQKPKSNYFLQFQTLWQMTLYMEFVSADFVPLLWGAVLSNKVCVRIFNIPLEISKNCMKVF